VIVDRAIDVVAEATRDLTVIVLQHTQQPLTPEQSKLLKQIAGQLRMLAGESGEP
jgi:hypothetical protein